MAALPYTAAMNAKYTASDVIAVVVGLLVAAAFFYIVPGVLLALWLEHRYGWSKQRMAWVIWVCIIASSFLVFWITGMCPPDGCGIGSDGQEHYDRRPY